MGSRAHHRHGAWRMGDHLACCGKQPAIEPFTQAVADADVRDPVQLGVAHDFVGRAGHQHAWARRAASFRKRQFEPFRYAQARRSRAKVVSVEEIPTRTSVQRQRRHHQPRMRRLVEECHLRRRFCHTAQAPGSAARRNIAARPVDIPGSSLGAYARLLDRQRSARRRSSNADRAVMRTPCVPGRRES